MLFKWMPVAWGGAALWLLILPPHFLSGLGWFRWLMLLACLLAGFFSFYLLMLLHELPEEVKIVPVPEADLAPFKAETHVLSGLGFVPAGMPMEVRTMVPVVVIPYWNAEWSTFCLLGRTVAWPPKPVYEMITWLDGGYGYLSSISDVGGDTFPLGVGEFRQVFPGAKLEDLFSKHREGVRHLHSREIHRREVSAMELSVELQALHRRRRKVFLSSLVRFTFQILLQRLSKHIPHRGVLFDQAV